MHKEVSWITTAPKNYIHTNDREAKHLFPITVLHETVFNLVHDSCGMTKKSISVTCIYIRTSGRNIQFICPARSRLDTILVRSNVNGKRFSQQSTSATLSDNKHGSLLASLPFRGKQSLLRQASLPTRAQVAMGDCTYALGGVCHS